MIKKHNTVKILKTYTWHKSMFLMSTVERRTQNTSHQTGPWAFIAGGPTGGAPKPLWFATPIMRCCGLVNIVLSILDV